MASLFRAHYRISLCLLAGLVLAFVLSSCRTTSHAQPFSDQELGQLFILGYKPEHFTEIVQSAEENLGGVIFFRKNIKSPDQLKRDIQKLKQRNPQLLVAVDQEGGKVQRLDGRSQFPELAMPSAKAISQYAPAEIKRRYEKLAKALVAIGFNLNLMPVVDIDKAESPTIGQLGRSYGDSQSIIRHARIAIAAHKKYGVLTSLKHFPGHGSAWKDTHDGFVDATRQWSPQELEPFRQLIRQQPESVHLVMISHMYNQQLDPVYPASLSKKTIDILRKTLNYKGAVISDDMQMKALSQYSLEKRVELALKAGNDLLIFSNQCDEQVRLKKLVSITQQLIKEGKLEPSIVRQAMGRVAKLKKHIE